MGTFRTKLAITVLGAVLVGCDNSPPNKTTEDANGKADDKPSKSALNPESDSKSKQQSDDRWYSGKYVVRSRYPHKIRIVRWEGYSAVCPATGWVTNGSECVMSFDNVPWTPESTEVFWRLAESQELQSQTIDLQGIVPANQSGYTEYMIDASGKWSVTFVRE